MRSGRLTEGDWTKRAEKWWADYLGIKHAVAVSSGTAGLMTAVMALAPDPEIPVTVPALTFAATWNAPLALGHSVRFLDCDGMFARLPEAHPSLTIPVHLMGVPHPRIQEFCEGRENPVIEDCCEAPGVSIGNRKIGTFGDCGVFSFYGSHPCPVGEFGFVVTDNDDIARTLRMVKNHGRPPDYPQGYFQHVGVGLNFKVTEVASCIAWHQLTQIAFHAAKRRINAARYQELDSKHIYVMDYPDTSTPHAQLLGVRTHAERDSLVKHLLSNEVECRAMFPVIAPEATNAISLSQRSLYVPVHERLTSEQLDYVMGVLRKWEP